MKPQDDPVARGIKAQGEDPFAFSPADRKRLSAAIGYECVTALELAGRWWQLMQSADSKATHDKSRRDMKAELVLLYNLGRALKPLVEAPLVKVKSYSEDGAYQARHNLGDASVRSMLRRVEEREKVLEWAIAETFPEGRQPKRVLGALKRDVRRVLAGHSVRGKRLEKFAAETISAITGRKVSDPLRSLRARN